MLSQEDIANQLRLNQGLELMEVKAPEPPKTDEIFDWMNLCGDCMLEEYRHIMIDPAERFQEIQPVGKFYTKCEGYSCQNEAHVKARYYTNPPYDLI